MNKAAIRALREPLTYRQLEMVALVANGFTHQEIARKLLLSDNTVRNTLADARERTNTNNLMHLVALCVAAGYISYSDDEFVGDKELVRENKV